MSEFARDSKIGNQDGIHPRHEAEDEKHKGENHHRAYIGFGFIHCFRFYMV